MYYNIIYPFNQTISGDTLSEAIKNYVKLNYDIKLTNLIVQDLNKNNFFKTNIKHYVNDGRNKVGINIFPTNSTFINNMPPFTSIISNNMPMATFDPVSPLNIISNPLPLVNSINVINPLYKYT